MRRTSRYFRDKLSRATLSATGLIRRVIFGTSAGSRWEALGFETDDATQGEADLVDVFQGVGIYARPKNDSAEGIVANIGSSAQHPTIVAVRDEAARQAFVTTFGRDLAAGETAIFNGAGNAYVVLAASGDVSIEVPSGQKIYTRTPGGGTDSLVLLTEYNAHTHTAPGGGGLTTTPTVAGVGTQILEAE